MKSKRYHLILDVSNSSNEILNNTETLTTFLNELPGKIGMSVLNPPVVVEGIPANPGITGFVIIDFSHISIHTFTAHGEALVDIFSCKPYEPEMAVEAVTEYFQVSKDSIRLNKVFWG